MKRIMLIYPPGRLYQRGEDRCQVNVEASSASTVRACNDLGYASALLGRAGYRVFLRDYQTEKRDWPDLLSDFRDFQPDALFISITNATIFDDLNIVKLLKTEKPGLMVMLKGAIFFNAEEGLLRQLDLSPVDYLIGGESDFIADRLADAHFKGCPPVESVPGILYRQDGQWRKTSFSRWEDRLDEYPFPDRARMNNRLYVRPDTGEPQATIAVSRGCPGSCTYCMTPRISGQKIRLRSPHNIVEELTECFREYGIRDFFFKSDTFTYHSGWVQELCGRILASPLRGKIRWVANSRAKPLQLATLQHMRAAGCWLVALGYESGSLETLVKIKKGTRPEDNLRAACLARQAGLKTFGFFLIGLPWEDASHLEATRKHLFELDPDFVELHMALPFYGTALYELARDAGLIREGTLGRDYFSAPAVGTKHLSIEALRAFRRRTLRAFYSRPGYVARKLWSAAGRPRTMINYAKYGLKLLFKK